MIVYNHDVVGIVNRLNRFMDEAYKSVSSSGSSVNSFDQARLQAYINAARVYIAHVVGQPQLDLPESHPRAYDVEMAPELANVENESINDILVYFDLARFGVINSQSARDASGLKGFDLTRLNSILDKAESLLQNYIASATPLDFPESSPQEEMSGPGKLGV